MSYKYKKKEDIIENLRDAGFDESAIECFLAEFCNGSKNVSREILKKHRKELLDAIHLFQKRMDCLDYFLYMLDKNEVHVG